MSMPLRTRRPGPDACPGVLTVWSADDGGLARVRLPGGRITMAGLSVLAAAADRFGTGELELTVRGNVQIRGLAGGTEPALAAVLRAAGLLPSDRHDRVRNIVASPATGLGGPDVGPLVAELDGALVADPILADLPGRFLFAVDDGTADVSALGADVGLFRAGAGYAVVLAGAVPKLWVGGQHAVAAAMQAAHAFLTERQRQGAAAWRLAELIDGPERIASAVAAVVPGERTGPALPTDALHRPRVPGPGMLPTPDGRGAVVVGVPDRRLPAAAAVALVELGAANEVRVTPWRSLLVPLPSPDAAGAVLAWARAHELEVGTS
jgi:precorrin-3B synthase